jgi:hypothetical protein
MRNQKLKIKHVPGNPENDQSRPFKWGKCEEGLHVLLETLVLELPPSKPQVTQINGRPELSDV